MCHMPCTTVESDQVTWILNHTSGKPFVMCSCTWLQLAITCHTHCTDCVDNTVRRETGKHFNFILLFVNFILLFSTCLARGEHEHYRSLEHGDWFSEITNTFHCDNTFHFDNTHFIRYSSAKVQIGIFAAVQNLG